MAAAMDGSAANPELLPRLPARSRRSIWRQGFFLVLFLVDVAPLVLLCVQATADREGRRDPSLLPAFLFCIAAPLVALAGWIGARRGWNALVLSFLALLTIAWPLFVAYVILVVLASAL
jgi:hypothetical protein